jgi:hypothetical protein
MQLGLRSEHACMLRAENFLLDSSRQVQSRELLTRSNCRLFVFLFLYALNPFEKVTLKVDSMMAKGKYRHALQPIVPDICLPAKALLQLQLPLLRASSPVQPDCPTSREILSETN